jgi:hypothetical protein
MTNAIERTEGILVIALVTFGAISALAQTNASKPSAVGTWTLDAAHSDFGSQPAPKSLTLTILKDTDEMSSWRVTGVDDKGKSFAFSWSGPKDGTMQPLKGSDGREMGKESLRVDQSALLRHGEDPTDGSSFDGRATMSDDGNTITDVVTVRMKDGKSTKATNVYRRTPAAKGSTPAEKKKL